MKIILKLTFLLYVIPLFFILGCKKYLEVKPDKSLVVITSLDDLQSILDKYLEVNISGIAALEAGGDNYYVVNGSWGSFNEYVKNMYMFTGSNYFPDFGYSGNAWSHCYDNVYRANTVFESITKIKRTFSNQSKWDDIKGQAYFLRGKSFLEATWTWCLAYDSTTAKTNLGIPLRLGVNFNKKSVRSSLEESYNQIINDLKAAARLLPIKPLSVMRASKPAAYALLARTYLSMRKYKKAGLYADSCLQLKNDLIDYNNDELVNSSSQTPFSQYNPEIIYMEVISANRLVLPSLARVDSNLYESYINEDLRKNIFFKSYTDKSVGFKGTYGSFGNFSGLATDEVYLIRAESYAREGNINAAMDDLNAVLSKRLRKGTFIPFFASTSKEALKLILTERRKELLFRGLRFIDIKRLNKGGSNIVQKHFINGETYILPPNDNRYAMPIPEQVISISGMKQNPI